MKHTISSPLSCNQLLFIYFMPTLTPAQQKHCAAVVQALQQNQTAIQPILATPFFGTEPIWFDFGSRNSALATIDMAHPEQLQNYIATTLQVAGKRFGVGRYNEDRVLYQSDLFRGDQTEARSVHLAYDLWLPVNTPLYAPLSGIIRGAQCNNQFLDYGATIILEHELAGITFYSLYGHLSTTSLTDKIIGQTIPAGTAFAWVGDTHENGQWAPHVHAEIICDLLGNVGDFPGVARPSERNYYTTLCPDPALLFKF